MSEEWPNADDEVYGWKGEVIGRGDSPDIVKNRSFLVGPYQCKSAGHWVMGYKVSRDACPVCDQKREAVA